MIFCFFGFFRNAQFYNNNFDLNLEKNVYVYSPSIRNENLHNDKITQDMLVNKCGINSKFILYEYNKQIFIDKKNRLNIPRFNQFFQQSYRIFSFFYNIKMVLEMTILENKYTNDDIIILSRIDIGLNLNNISLIDKLLLTYDVVLGEGDSNYTDDKWFIFKYKNIQHFISLYDDYEIYLLNFYNNNTLLPTTRPEDVFTFHLKNKNLKFINTGNNIINYTFHHLCSEYCGHNGENTLE